MVAIIQSFSKKISSYHSRAATPKLMILWSSKNHCNEVSSQHLPVLQADSWKLLIWANRTGSW